MGRASEDNRLEELVSRLDSVVGRLEGSIPTERRRDEFMLPDRLPVAALEFVYNSRRIRKSVFGADADLFGEPAWDILLDAAIMESRGKSVSVTSACLAADVPSTTALRYVTALEERDFLGRESDPFDNRKKYVRLTQKGKRLLKQYVETIANSAHAQSII